MHGRLAKTRIKQMVIHKIPLSTCTTHTCPPTTTPTYARVGVGTGAMGQEFCVCSQVCEYAFGRQCGVALA